GSPQGATGRGPGGAAASVGARSTEANVRCPSTIISRDSEAGRAGLVSLRWAPSQLGSLSERRHHLLGEQSRGLARVAAEELDHESADSERAVALDPLDHAFGRAPDPVLLERASHVAAVDLLGLVERGAGRGLVFRDHHHALLGDLDRAGIAAELLAAP